MLGPRWLVVMLTLGACLLANLSNTSAERHISYSNDLWRGWEGLSQHLAGLPQNVPENPDTTGSTRSLELAIAKLTSTDTSRIAPPQYVGLVPSTAPVAPSMGASLVTNIPTRSQVGVADPLLSPDITTPLVESTPFSEPNLEHDRKNVFKAIPPPQEAQLRRESQPRGVAGSVQELTYLAGSTPATRAQGLSSGDPGRTTTGSVGIGRVGGASGGVGVGVAGIGRFGVGIGGVGGLRQPTLPLPSGPRSPIINYAPKQDRVTTAILSAAQLTMPQATRTSMRQQSSMLPPFPSAASLMRGNINRVSTGGTVATQRVQTGASKGVIAANTAAQGIPTTRPSTGTHNFPVRVAVASDMSSARPSDVSASTRIAFHNNKTTDSDHLTSKDDSGADDGMASVESVKNLDPEIIQASIDDAEASKERAEAALEASKKESQASEKQLNGALQRMKKAKNDFAKAKTKLQAAIKTEQLGILDEISARDNEVQAAKAMKRAKAKEMEAKRKLAIAKKEQKKAKDDLKQEERKRHAGKNINHE